MGGRRAESWSVAVKPYLTLKQRRVRPTRPTASMAQGGCWFVFGEVGEWSVCCLVSQVLAEGAPRRVGKRWATCAIKGARGRPRKIRVEVKEYAHSCDEIIYTDAMMAVVSCRSPEKIKLWHHSLCTNVNNSSNLQSRVRQILEIASSSIRFAVSL